MNNATISGENLNLFYHLNISRMWCVLAVGKTWYLLLPYPYEKAFINSL
jgi:hypothetical protein